MDLNSFAFGVSVALLLSAILSQLGPAPKLTIWLAAIGIVISLVRIF